MKGFLKSAGTLTRTHHRSMFAPNFPRWLRRTPSGLKPRPQKATTLSWAKQPMGHQTPPGPRPPLHTSSPTGASCPSSSGKARWSSHLWGLPPAAHVTQGRRKVLLPTLPLTGHANSQATTATEKAYYKCSLICQDGGRRGAAGVAPPPQTSSDLLIPLPLEPQHRKKPSKQFSVIFQFRLQPGTGTGIVSHSKRHRVDCELAGGSELLVTLASGGNV